jgi:hypothetical protein
VERFALEGFGFLLSSRTVGALAVIFRHGSARLVARVGNESVNANTAASLRRRVANAIPGSRRQVGYAECRHRMITADKSPAWAGGNIGFAETSEPLSRSHAGTGREQPFKAGRRAACEPFR